MTQRTLIACLAAAAPGANGRSNLVEPTAFFGTGARPRHDDDQRDMYARLLGATPGLTAASLATLFRDASFGSPPGGQARAYSPAPGLTITRDAAFGVPHVYGTTRAAAMFDLGYVAAEDRLSLTDALRHVASGRLSSFAGGAAGNRRQDAEQWPTAPCSGVACASAARTPSATAAADVRAVPPRCAARSRPVRRRCTSDRCAAAGQPGDQAGFDKIAFRAVGGITQPMIAWQNRPTYQLAVEVQGHRPR